MRLIRANEQYSLLALAALDLVHSLNNVWSSVLIIRPHLSILYELLLHLVLTPKAETSVKKKALDSTFVVKLMQLFDSQVRSVAIQICSSQLTSFVQSFTTSWLLQGYA